MMIFPSSKEKGASVLDYKFPWLLDRSSYIQDLSIDLFSIDAGIERRDHLFYNIVG